MPAGVKTRERFKCMARKKARRRASPRKNLGATAPPHQPQREGAGRNHRTESIRHCRAFQTAVWSVHDFKKSCIES